MKRRIICFKSILYFLLFLIVSCSTYSKDNEKQVGSSILVMKSSGKDSYRLYFGNEVAMIIKQKPVDGKNLYLDAFAETENALSKDAIYEMIEFQPVNGWMPLIMTSQYMHHFIFSKGNMQIKIGDLLWGTHGYCVTERRSLLVLLQGVRSFEVLGLYTDSAPFIETTYNLEFTGHLERKLVLHSDELGLFGYIDDRGMLFGIDWGGFRKSIEKIKLEFEIEKVSKENYLLKIDGDPLIELEYRQLKNKGGLSKEYGKDYSIFKNSSNFGLLVVKPLEGWQIEKKLSTFPVAARLMKGKVFVDVYGLFGNGFKAVNAQDGLKVLITENCSMKILASQSVVGFDKKKVRQSCFISYEQDKAELVLEVPYYSREVPEHPFDSEKNYCKVSEKIKPPTNLDKEKEIQTMVDSGHQPWRMDAVQVATSFLKTLNPEIEMIDCVHEDSYDRYSAVSCEKEKLYYVLLERLVRKDGIWTVTTVEISDR